MNDQIEAREKFRQIFDMKNYLRFNQDKTAEEGEETPDWHKHRNDVRLWLVRFCNSWSLLMITI